MMTKDDLRNSPATQFLLGMLITLIGSVGVFGFNSLGNKVEKDVFDIHSKSQAEQFERIDKGQEKMNDKLDILIKKEN